MTVRIEDIKQVVREAGQLAMLYYGKVSRGTKADQSVVTEADGAVENYFRLALSTLAPAYGYIGEETEESKAPAPGQTRAWVVDALDGSRAFSARLPLWTPAVCLLDGNRPIKGAAYNPTTDELFWVDETGPAYCNDEPLSPRFKAELKPNTFILGPTNHHRSFTVDFPGRIYCLGAPIYQFCLTAKGSVDAMFFDPAINLWDLALPSLLLERVGAALVYASGKPVDIAALMDRSQVAEAVFAGGSEMVEALRARIRPTGQR